MSGLRRGSHARFGRSDHLEIARAHGRVLVRLARQPIRRTCVLHGQPAAGEVGEPVRPPGVLSRAPRRPRSPASERAGSSKPRRPEGPGNHVPPELMKGGRGEKVCLITGATSGIGKATAMGLASMGASVVMVGRDRGRGEAAMADIKENSGNASVGLMLADVSSQEEIRRLADEFKEAFPRLDVLINNAGVFRSKRITTADGIEMTFAVNHLAYFLLTNLLLDVLKASAPSRIVNVASGEQRNGAIDFDDLQGEKRYKGAKAYSQSKLATVLFTYELARRLERTGGAANRRHPRRA